MQHIEIGNVFLTWNMLYLTSLISISLSELPSDPYDASKDLNLEQNKTL